MRRREVPDYPTYDEIVASRIGARRAEGLRALQLADDKVRGVGGRLVVFGSLVEGGFDERSDIDAALLGLFAGDDERLAVESDTDLVRAGFASDIVPGRFLTPWLRDRIERPSRETSALG